MITDTRPTTSARGPAAVAAVAVALTCAAAALGTLPDWASPVRTLSGWQVAAVPPGTLAVVVAVAAVCVAVAAALVRPGSSLPGSALPLV